ncbi:hypothetical protein GJ496_009228 [Pomphorhynchus laevis]|nr:hypothetical protein GJ496_009228 [Pomphorhynchus laevis]
MTDGHRQFNNDHDIPIDQNVDELMEQGGFWDKLRSFGTEERDDLISKFRAYTQTSLSDNGIRFFMEMVNWNLQAAIGAFYDFEQPRNDVEPSLQLVSDTTVGDGEAVTPNTQFVKRWCVKNTGPDEWPFGTVLRFVNGDIAATEPIVPVGRLAPGSSTEVSVSMVSPSEPGTYRSVWRAYDAAGMPFGETIWVIVTVDDSGVLGITQQLNDCNAFGQARMNNDDSFDKDALQTD